MKTPKDKFNIGIDIYDQTVKNGTTLVTVCLMDLLRMESEQTKAIKENDGNKKVIHNLVNSNKFLLDCIDTES